MPPVPTEEVEPFVTTFVLEIVVAAPLDPPVELVDGPLSPHAARTRSDGSAESNRLREDLVESIESSVDVLSS
jgi:hypothetical protein